MSHNSEQVQMVWPQGKTGLTSQFNLPEGYTLRTYQPGDEVGFYALMASVDWTGWDEDKLRPWLYRTLPEGWFFATHEKSGELVGSCMATHDPTWESPFCGEVGWTVVHPDQQGKGLGKTLVSAVLGRFLRAGYSCIHLYTEVWRLAALKVYLDLGFVPYLQPPETTGQWEKICSQLDCLFEPERWPGELDFWT